MQNRFLESSLRESERYLIKPTGFLRDGLDEYVYIGQLQTSQPDRNATGFFKILKLTGTDANGLKEFDVSYPLPTKDGWFSYFIKDGLGFKTLFGTPVYAENPDGTIKTEMVNVEQLVVDENGDPVLDADGNQQTTTVQEERQVELLEMFSNSMNMDLTPVNVTFGEALASAMHGTIVRRIHGNNKPV